MTDDQQIKQWLEDLNPIVGLFERYDREQLRWESPYLLLIDLVHGPPPKGVPRYQEHKFGLGWDEALKHPEVKRLWDKAASLIPEDQALELEESGMYEFVCNRCTSRADDTSRAEVEAFAEHHYKLVHPLYAGEQALEWFVSSTVLPGSSPVLSPPNDVRRD